MLIERPNHIQHDMMALRTANHSASTKAGSTNSDGNYSNNMAFKPQVKEFDVTSGSHSLSCCGWVWGCHDICWYWRIHVARLWQVTILWQLYYYAMSGDFMAIILLCYIRQHCGNNITMLCHVTLWQPYCAVMWLCGNHITMLCHVMTLWQSYYYDMSGNTAATTWLFYVRWLYDYHIIVLCHMTLW